MVGLMVMGRYLFAVVYECCRVYVERDDRMARIPDEGDTSWCAADFRLAIFAWLDGEV